MKMVFAIGLAVMLTSCAGGYHNLEGPLVDMGGVDQNKYNNDLSQCRSKKEAASFVGAGHMISDCMAERGYRVIEKRG